MYDWSRSPAQNARPPDRFQLLLKGCTIEAKSPTSNWWRLDIVSVVVERMYDWSLNWGGMLLFDRCVSVVVERMYDWSLNTGCRQKRWSFSCCWKDVRLKRCWHENEYRRDTRFSCCWKDVRLKPANQGWKSNAKQVSVVVERMYDWSYISLGKVCRVKSVSVVVERMYDWSIQTSSFRTSSGSFSCCWKDVRLKHGPPTLKPCSPSVSVVVERMYDWSGLMIHSKSGLQVVSVVVERMYDWSEGQRNSDFGRQEFQLLLKGCTIEAPKPTDWKQMIFDSWFLICFSKMVDLHKKCHYFRKFGVIWVIAWLFLIVVVTSSYIFSTTKSP